MHSNSELCSLVVIGKANKVFACSWKSLGMGPGILLSPKKFALKNWLFRTYGLFKQKGMQMTKLKPFKHLSWKQSVEIHFMRDFETFTIICII